MCTLGLVGAVACEGEARCDVGVLRAVVVTFSESATRPPSFRTFQIGPSLWPQTTAKLGEPITACVKQLFQ